MARTNYQRNQELDHFWRTNTAAKPDHIYIHLLESSPATTSTIADLDQPSAGASAQLDPSDTNWARPSNTNGTVFNNVGVTFTADATWALTHFAISDGTNVRFYGPLTTPRNAAIGDQMTFGVGDFTIVET